MKGIESRIDYLAEIGVEAVWISPFFTSPMIDFGYDISNFTDVDPIFGTMDDFKSLLNLGTIHKRRRQFSGLLTSPPNCRQIFSTYYTVPLDNRSPRRLPGEKKVTAIIN